VGEGKKSERQISEGLGREGWRRMSEEQEDLWEQKGGGGLRRYTRYIYIRAR
jgi:hypothetical protein